LRLLGLAVFSVLDQLADESTAGLERRTAIQRLRFVHRRIELAKQPRPGGCARRFDFTGPRAETKTMRRDCTFERHALSLALSSAPH
jgi:hypothetical protein